MISPLILLSVKLVENLKMVVKHPHCLTNFFPSPSYFLCVTKPELSASQTSCFWPGSFWDGASGMHLLECQWHCRDALDVRIL